MERAVHDLVLAVVDRRTPPGTSVVVEGAPGVGKTFLTQAVTESVPPGTATIVRLAGEPGRRHDPFAGAGPLLGDTSVRGDPGDAAFDRVDELCAEGPVVLCADDAHHLDAATLTLLRRLVWASRSLPLAVLVTTRPYPVREPLTMLIQQAAVRLRLPPMGPMMVERLVYDRTGRWPGPLLRRALGLAAGNPLFASELLRAYQDAGALAEVGADSVEARFELDSRGAGLDELIRAQLAQLDEPTRDVLAAMAVWGTEVGAATWAACCPATRTTWTSCWRGPSRPAWSAATRPARSASATACSARSRTTNWPRLSIAICTGRSRGCSPRPGTGPASSPTTCCAPPGPTPTPAWPPPCTTRSRRTRGYAPEVTADLLDDAAALRGPDVPDQLLLDHVDALFHQGRCRAAETLIRERIMTVTDPAVAAQMQLILIRSLINRADLNAVLAVMDRTIAIAGLPDVTRRQLEGSRAFLLTQAGQAPPAAELDAMMARFTAAGDQDAQANLLATVALSAFQAGHPDRALELLGDREALVSDLGSLRSRSSALAMPAIFLLAASRPAAAQAALDQARRLSAERHAEWVDPILGFVAGGIAFTVGDWDGAVAELDAALEQAEETGNGWISLPVEPAVLHRRAPWQHRPGPGPGWTPSGTAACRWFTGTTVRAGPNWPCWRPREQSARRAR